MNNFNKVLCIILGILVVLSYILPFVSAAGTNFGYNTIQGGGGTVTVNAVINETTTNVNNSQFLEGHPASYFYPFSNPSAFISTELDPVFTSWLSTFFYDYNQTTAANDYTDSIVSANNASWSSTYNSTYDQWAYNQTYSGGTYNSTYDATTNQWNGNYSAYSQYWYNQTYSGSTFNQTYADTSADVAANRSDWFSTYNSTYDQWAYNQTYSGSTYNATYDAKNTSQWIVNGNNISNRNSGNVGIGTTITPEKLTIDGNILFKSGTTRVIYPEDETFGRALWIYAGNSFSEYGGPLVLSGGSSNDNTGVGGDVSINPGSGSISGDVLIGGNENTRVGINILNPTEALHVEGNILSNQNITATDWLKGKLNYSDIQNAPVISSSTYNSTYDATSQDVTANRSAWFSTYNATYDAKNSSQWLTIGDNIYNRNNGSVNLADSLVFNYSGPSCIWTGSLKTGLMSYYRLNETAVDEIAGRNLTASLVPPYTTTGKIGGALQSYWEVFTYYQVPSAAHPTNNGSMNFWWNQSVAPNNNIVMADNVSNNNGDIYVTPAGKIYWQYNGTDGLLLCTGIKNDSVYHMITLIYNTTTTDCYLDGSYNATDSSHVVTMDAHNWNLMRDAGTSAVGTEMDELSFWNKSLSASEITTLYNSGAGKTYCTSSAASGTVSFNNTAGFAFNNNITADWFKGKVNYSDIQNPPVTSQWITNGGNIYYQNLTGNVGIGTTNPLRRLQINGTGNTPQFLISGTGASSANNLFFQLVNDSISFGSATNLGVPYKTTASINVVDGVMTMEKNLGIGIGNKTFFGGAGNGYIWTPTVNNLEVFGYNTLIMNTHYNSMRMDGTSFTITNDTVITNGTSRFFVKITTGNIGIGTVSPLTTLQVQTGQISAPIGTNETPSYSFIGRLDTGMYSPAAAQVALVAGNVTGIRCDGSGNCGIKTTTAPKTALQVGTTFYVNNTAGNVGIATSAPGYPLEVNSSVSGISIYALANISATGYITRTDVYDKSLGSALDSIQDASTYKSLDGSIDHSAFAYSAVSYDRQVPDYTYNTTEKVCDTIPAEYDENLTIIVESKEICKDVIVENTAYKTIKEEGVDLVKEVALLKQATYELKEKVSTLEEENKQIKESLCSLKVFDWCVIK